MSDLPLLEGPVVKPKSGRSDYLVVLLHGVGADGNDLISLATMLRDTLPQATFISPDAHEPCDMAPMGRQWFSLSNRDPDVMEEGVRNAAPVLNNFIDDQLKMLGLDDSKLAVIGFSQGSMLALHTMLRRPKPCAGVVAFSGAMIGGHTLLDEITAKPPVALIHGDMDQVVPYAAMGLAHEALEEAGVEADTLTAHNVGHGIDPVGLQFAAEFLASKLGVAGSEAA